MRDEQVAVCVPSGNFGNLTAGLFAKRMGLPVSRFVAATNVNDVVPEYLHTGSMVPRPSRHTISNAMDVGNPSNFARMMDLYNADLKAMQQDITGYAFTDAETKNAMQLVARDNHYILDPHGAVAYLGIRKYLADNPSTVNGIFLETAHPAKFGEVVENAIGESIPLPETLQKFLSGKKQALMVDGGYESFKKTLIKELN